MTITKAHYQCYKNKHHNTTKDYIINDHKGPVKPVSCLSNCGITYSRVLNIIRVCCFIQNIIIIWETKQLGYHLSWKAGGLFYRPLHTILIVHRCPQDGVQWNLTSKVTLGTGRKCTRNLQWKTTCLRGPPVLEDHLFWETTCHGGPIVLIERPPVLRDHRLGRPPWLCRRTGHPRQILLYWC